MLPPSVNRFRPCLNAARPSGSPSRPLAHNSVSLRAEAQRPERLPIAGAGGRRSPFTPFKYSKKSSNSHNLKRICSVIKSSLPRPQLTKLKRSDFVFDEFDKPSSRRRAHSPFLFSPPPLFVHALGTRRLGHGEGWDWSCFAPPLPHDNVRVTLHRDEGPSPQARAGTSF